jgi:hypothetical protein
MKARSRSIQSDGSPFETPGLTFSQIRQLDPPVDYYQPYQPIGGNGESHRPVSAGGPGLQQIVRHRSAPGGFYGIDRQSLVRGVGDHSPGGSRVFSGNTTYINLGYSNEMPVV